MRSRGQTFPASDEEVFRGFEDGHDSVRKIIEHGQGWKRWVLWSAAGLLETA